MSLVGRTLGQYEIKEELGQGGMAKVYLGYQASIDRYAAIKVLPPHPALDEQFKERFQLEAKTIGGLQNPNILPLYDYGTQDDVIYLVMAYVEGGTLEDLIDSGPMDVHDVERILRNVASGLDYAHRRGIIHRDIKPANILMSDGHPLLADFGLVKMVASGGNLTGTAIIGTPSYMAPEQGQGLEVDARTDIYALGIVVYEMLAGKRPYEGATPMFTIFKHINDPVPDILQDRPDVPAEIAAVLEKALAKNPLDRYETAGAFAEAFTAAIHKNEESLADIQITYPIDDGDKDKVKQPETAVLEPVNQTQRTSPSSETIVIQQANPLVMLGGFGFIALVIVIVAVLLINRQGNPPPPRPTEVAEVISNPTSPPVSSVPTFGDVFFSSVDATGDAVTVSVNELHLPAADNQLVAWLLNTETGDVLLLDRLVVDSFGRGSLTYVDAEGHLLPVNYNALIITEESDIGDTPSDNIVYHAEVPATVSEALRAILIESENGFENSDGTHGSLLDGALVEAGFGEQHAALAAGASNLGGMQTHAEHTINILHGTEEDYNGNGRGENPGRKVGVFFFMDEIQRVLDEAITHEDATTELQVNAENINVCVENVRLWANEVTDLDMTILAGESLEVVTDEAQQAKTLAAQIKVGFDANDNGVIEAFEGECGLEQIPGFALETARMQIVEGSLDI